MHRVIAKVAKVFTIYFSFILRQLYKQTIGCHLHTLGVLCALYNVATLSIEHYCLLREAFTAFLQRFALRINKLQWQLCKKFYVAK